MSPHSLHTYHIETIAKIESIEWVHIEDAISRYLIEKKGMAQESFRAYLDKARQIDQSVYNVICEIENVITYEELQAVFHSLTGIPTAQALEGTIRHVNADRSIITVVEHENGHSTTHTYVWHPSALKGLGKNHVDTDRFFLLRKDDFRNIELKNKYGDSAGPAKTRVSHHHLSREFIYPFIKDALIHGITDIHIFPQENQNIYKIRFRLLGDLVDVYTLKIEKGRSLVNVLINWAKEKTPSLKTDEKRRPLDGRIICKKEQLGWHCDIDIRMSLIWKPDATDSDVVLRILARTAIGKEKLYDLGYLDYHADILETAVSRNRGIILVTGPTGSGKSRTINTLLASVPSARCILCVEDPIEYQLPNGRQFQTFEYMEDTGNERGKAANIHVIGFSEFARAFKRHDPDVIFIGELRDNETVNTAMHLSKTGHLVLGTLHVSRASQIPQMLVEDYGVSVDAVADNLIVGVNQVLVKKLCDRCKEIMDESLTRTPEWMEKLRYPEKDIFLNSIRGKRFYTPGVPDGCDICKKTTIYGGHGGTRRTLSIGYSGRTVLGEAIEFKPDYFSDGKISGYLMETKVRTDNNSHSILMDACNKLALGTIDLDAIRRLL